MYKYPWIRNTTYDELDEFVKRLLGSLIIYLPPYKLAGVYNEMAHELVKIEGVSTEGASWAMEGANERT